MPTRVLVNGAHGRMGSLAVKAVEQSPDLKVVGTADINDNLRQAILDSKAEVVVDFTVASVGYETALTIIEAGARPVIGTSGFVSEQVEKLSELCAKKKIGGVIAPNFSISAVLMMKYSQDAARYLPNVEIIELHHDGKEDSPSGTAIRTAEMIQEAIGNVTPPKLGKELVPHARGGTHRNIPVHSLRLPGLVAHQEVIFGGVGQTLTIRSDSLNRDAFMPGVVLACKKAPQLDRLYYGLEHLL